MVVGMARPGRAWVGQVGGRIPLRTDRQSQLMRHASGRFVLFQLQMVISTPSMRCHGSGRLSPSGHFGFEPHPVPNLFEHGLAPPAFRGFSVSWQ